MSSIKEDIIDEVFFSYCENQMTEKDQILLQRWLEQDAENKNILRKMKEAYQLSKMLHILQTVDTDVALHKVKQSLKLNRHSWLQSMQRYAAILFIPFFFVNIVLLYHIISEAYKSNLAHVEQQMSIRTNPGMVTQLELPDGTVVFLNSNSEITYPVKFSEEQRTVHLEGEAYFDVVKDDSKRFVVNVADNINIEVFGTSFNVDAYKNNDFISTTLVEGSVKFNYSDCNDKFQRVLLHPNHKLVYDKKNKSYSCQYTKCKSEIAWKNGEIVLENTPFADILEILSKRFNVQFVLNNSKLINTRFTGTFTSQRLDRILEYFKMSSNIDWRYIEDADLSNTKQKIEIF